MMQNSTISCMGIEHGALEVRRKRLLVADEVVRVAPGWWKLHRDSEPTGRDDCRCAARRMGIYSRATSGRVRVIASSGRRSSNPHLPPVTYCSISRTSAPPARLKRGHIAHQIGAEDVALASTDEYERQREQSEDDRDDQSAPAPGQQNIRRVQRGRQYLRPAVVCAAVLSVLFVLRCHGS